MDDDDLWFADPELPEEVFAALGRITLAAVRLEDAVYTVCRAIQPRHGPWDDCPIGTHINEAIGDLAECPADEIRVSATAWLTEAKAALEQRNAILHAVPVSYVPLPGTTPIPGVASDWLAHFPRDKKKPAIHTPLTVPGLTPILRRLRSARRGWIALATHEWPRAREGPASVE